MPTTETLERFIRRVAEGAHAEACEEFYIEHSTMQEKQGKPRECGFVFWIRVFEI
jgi:hypothetical protein